jgi:hypothetical protein
VADARAGAQWPFSAAGFAEQAQTRTETSASHWTCHGAWRCWRWRSPTAKASHILASRWMLFAAGNSRYSLKSSYLGAQCSVHWTLRTSACIRSGIGFFIPTTAHDGNTNVSERACFYRLRSRIPSSFRQGRHYSILWRSAVDSATKGRRRYTPNAMESNTHPSFTYDCSQHPPPILPLRYPSCSVL